MADFGMILDLSHLAEQAYYQALDTYRGAAVASHSNPRRFCPSERGLSDEMISLLAARNGVIGLVPYNVFLKSGWRKGDNRGEVSLEVLADAIDHVCQVTGSDQHVGLGTDFDGGFGVEHTPFEIDTIADLQVLGSVLTTRGYTQAQIEGFMGGNWLRVLHQALPD
jgi:membrane dipeptidase